MKKHITLALLALFLTAFALENSIAQKTNDNGNSKGKTQENKGGKKKDNSNLIIGGTYAVEGTNPNGTQYVGTCIVTEISPGNYSFSWTVKEVESSGTGTLEGNILTVDFGANYPVIYKVLYSGNQLDGTWENGSASEILTLVTR